MKENSQAITEELLYYLAVFYYDHFAINWDKLYNLSLFIYKNNKYGPKGCKKLSLEMFKLYKLIKKYAKICPSMFYKDGNPLPLGVFDQFGHHDLYNKIAHQANEARLCIFDLAKIDNYIYKKAEIFIKNVNYFLKNNLIEKKAETLLKNELNELVKSLEKKVPEDAFRLMRKIYHILNEQEKSIKEQTILNQEEMTKRVTFNKEHVKKINAYLEMDRKNEILNPVDTNILLSEIKNNDSLSEDIKKTLYNYLFELNVAIISNNTELYNERLNDINDRLNITLTRK